MKVYSAGLSPFAARVRLAIYACGLPVEVADPPAGGLKSPEFLAINPIGKIPALVLDDGSVIPESDTIVEYLADAFPESGLKPAAPYAAAQARLIARVVELYVMTPGAALFGQMSPKGRDEAVVANAFAALEKGLEHLNRYLPESGLAAGDRVTLADCAVVPVLMFVGVFGQVFGKGDLLAAHPRVAAYWSRAQGDASVRKVLGEMQEGLAAARAR